MLVIHVDVLGWKPVMVVFLIHVNSSTYSLDLTDLCKLSLYHKLPVDCIKSRLQWTSVLTVGQY